MIDPNRYHRAHAVIVEIGKVESYVRLSRTKAKVLCWTSDLPKGAFVGQPVNVQARFSITMDQYVCKTVKSASKPTGHVVEALCSLAYKHGLRFEYLEFLNLFCINGHKYTMSEALNKFRVLVSIEKAASNG